MVVADGVFLTWEPPFAKAKTNCYHILTTAPPLLLLGNCRETHIHYTTRQLRFLTSGAQSLWSVKGLTPYRNAAFYGQIQRARQKGLLHHRIHNLRLSRATLLRFQSFYESLDDLEIMKYYQTVADSIWVRRTQQKLTDRGPKLTVNFSKKQIIIFYLSLESVW